MLLRGRGVFFTTLMMVVINMMMRTILSQPPTVPWWLQIKTLHLCRFTGPMTEKYSNRAKIKVFSYHMTGSCLSWIHRHRNASFDQCLEHPMPPHLHFLLDLILSSMICLRHHLMSALGGEIFFSLVQMYHIETLKTLVLDVY